LWEHTRINVLRRIKGEGGGEEEEEEGRRRREREHVGCEIKRSRQIKKDVANHGAIVFLPKISFSSWRRWRTLLFFEQHTSQSASFLCVSPLRLLFHLRCERFPKTLVSRFGCAL
jgi:hypothetical protein